MVGFAVVGFAVVDFAVVNSAIIGFTAIGSAALVATAASRTLIPVPRCVQKKRSNLYPEQRGERFV